jgi:hypothetical protein
LLTSITSSPNCSACCPRPRLRSTYKSWGWKSFSTPKVPPGRWSPPYVSLTSLSAKKGWLSFPRRTTQWTTWSDCQLLWATSPQGPAWKTWTTSNK